jgi:hypothetical protein
MPADVTRAVETRIVDLKARGGTCSRYGTVLETSYRSGRIVIRPFMWRVGSHLASGEAKPNGDMTLAREIDSLNVGVRTVDDVLWSMEHEAVHIAFDLVSGVEASEVRVQSFDDTHLLTGRGQGQQKALHVPRRQVRLCGAIVVSRDHGSC